MKQQHGPAIICKFYKGGTTPATTLRGGTGAEEGWGGGGASSYSLSGLLFLLQRLLKLEQTEFLLKQGADLPGADPGLHVAQDVVHAHVTSWSKTALSAETSRYKGQVPSW